MTHEASNPPEHFSLEDVVRETYAGVQVLLDRTSDLPQIRSKLESHAKTISVVRWLGGIATALIIGYLGFRLFPTR